MSRYIDAERLSQEVIASWYNNKHCTIEASRVHRQEHHHLMRIIEKQPIADVVEVVRCRDCKHNADNGGDCNRTITHTSRDLVCEVNEYKYIGLEYCSYGERREE